MCYCILKHRAIGHKVWVMMFLEWAKTTITGLCNTGCNVFWGKDTLLKLISEFIKIHSTNLFLNCGIYFRQDCHSIHACKAVNLYIFIQKGQKYSNCIRNSHQYEFHQAPEFSNRNVPMYI